MKWLLIIGGAIVVLILVIVLIGALLPRTHVTLRRVNFKQSPATVFAVITDWRSYPTWRSDVSSVSEWKGSGDARGWTEVSRHGSIPLQIIESSGPTKFVVKIADPNLPFGGTWTYDIAADVSSDQSCSLTITENGEVGNPLFRFMSRFVFGYTATMDAYLKSLGRKFGQEVHF